MISFKFSSFKPLFFSGILILTALPCGIRAQYWHAIAPGNDRPALLTFSQDEKRIFYLSKENGASNLFVQPLKGGPPIAITKFTDTNTTITFHLINRPQVLLERITDPSSGATHLYVIADDGKGEPQDITSGQASTNSRFIGASYNGRYIYYLSDKIRAGRPDVYRYDTQQYTSEEVLPNDENNYYPMAWSRDQTHLLIKDEKGEVFWYDINTTEKQSVGHLASPTRDLAFLDPQNRWIVFVSNGVATTYSRMDLTSKVVNDLAANGIDDYSPNGKFIVHGNMLRDAMTDTSLPYLENPNGSGITSLSIAPKEDLIVYALPDKTPGSKRIMIYDIAKKTTVDLGGFH